jgi:hypothetical protein
MKQTNPRLLQKLCESVYDSTWQNLLKPTWNFNTNLTYETRNWTEKKDWTWPQCQKAENPWPLFLNREGGGVFVIMIKATNHILYGSPELWSISYILLFYTSTARLIWSSRTPIQPPPPPPPKKYREMWEISGSQDAEYKDVTFWDIVPCSLEEVDRRFKGDLWWWRQCASPKRWPICTRLHGAISQKAAVFISENVP